MLDIGGLVQRLLKTRPMKSETIVDSNCAARSMSYVHSESEGRNVGEGSDRDVWCDLRGGMRKGDI